MSDLVIEAVPAQDLFDKQRAYFATDVTKTYEWRVDQLNRLVNNMDGQKDRLDTALQKAPENYRKLVRTGSYGSTRSSMGS